MAEKQQPQKEQTEASQAVSESKSPVSRPRMLSDAERVIEHEEKRSLQREVRELTQFPDITAPERPHSSSSIVIEQQERWVLDAQEPSQAGPANGISRIIEEREMVKWAAWVALFVSLVTSFLLGLYSSREFEPMFEYYDLEVTQKQLSKDVELLQYSSQLEKIQNAILHAQVQLFIRKDYGAAEAILEGAKEELKLFIDVLPVEKTIKPKHVLTNIEHALAEVRQGPTSLEQQLNEISTELSKMKQ